MYVFYTVFLDNYLHSNFIIYTFCLISHQESETLHMQMGNYENIICKPHFMLVHKCNFRRLCMPYITYQLQQLAIICLPSCVRCSQRHLYVGLCFYAYAKVDNLPRKFSIISVEWLCTCLIDDFLSHVQHVCSVSGHVRVNQKNSPRFYYADFNARMYVYQYASQHQVTY